MSKSIFQVCIIIYAIKKKASAGANKVWKLCLLTFTIFKTFTRLAWLYLDHSHLLNYNHNGFYLVILDYRNCNLNHTTPPSSHYISEIRSLLKYAYVCINWIPIKNNCDPYKFTWIYNRM